MDDLTINMVLPDHFALVFIEVTSLVVFFWPLFSYEKMLTYSVKQNIFKKIISKIHQ